MAGSILGTRVLRTEDPALLTGSGERTSTTSTCPASCTPCSPAPRSPTPRSAPSTSTTPSPMPGVVAVFTAADLGVAPHHGFVTVHPDFARPPLADGVVRFVGEAIAIVVAETVRRRRRRRRRGVGRLRAAAGRSSTPRRRSPTARR